MRRDSVAGEVAAAKVVAVGDRVEEEARVVAVQVEEEVKVWAAAGVRDKAWGAVVALEPAREESVSAQNAGPRLRTNRAHRVPPRDAPNAGAS